MLGDLLLQYCSYISCMTVAVQKQTKLKTTNQKETNTCPPQPPPQPFYSPFSGTTRMSQCQKRTSGLYGAKKD